jgi:hypothetical protein
MSIHKRLTGSYTLLLGFLGLAPAIFGLTSIPMDTFLAQLNAAA